MSDVQAELTKQMKALVDALEAAAAREETWRLRAEDSARGEREALALVRSRAGAQQEALIESNDRIAVATLAAALLQRGPCLLRDAVEDAQDVLGVLPLESP